MCVLIGAEPEGDNLFFLYVDLFIYFLPGVIVQGNPQINICLCLCICAYMYEYMFLN